MTSLFLILSSFSQWHLQKIVYIQSKYIKNQVVYYIGKLINRQSRAFWTKKKFWFLHYILWVVFCVTISRMNSQKYENHQQLNSDWLTSLKTWYYFGGFSYFGCDLTVIKKSCALNCYSVSLKFLLKTQIYKLVGGNCGS